MPETLKILTADRPEGTYTCYLTLDEQVELTVFQPADRIIGTRLSWHELPWNVRQEFESEIDPHNV